MASRSSPLFARTRALRVAGGLLTTGLLFWSCSQFARLPADSHALAAISAFPDVQKPKIWTLEELTGAFKEMTLVVARQPRRNLLSLEPPPPVAVGSGVVIFADHQAYLVLSSRHIIDGPNWRHARPFSGRVALAPEKADFTFAKVVGRHRALDLVLIMAKRHSGKGSFVQPIADHSGVAPGERILVFGHPTGLFFSVSDGEVLRKPGEDFIPITVPVRQGMSGGPVYDLRGRLVGIATRTADEQRNSGGENVNLAVRADSLLQPQDWILDSKGVRLLNEFLAASPDRVK
jgi:S1-C subfamily serine protease